MKVRLCTDCRYQRCDIVGNYSATAREYLCMDCPRLAEEPAACMRPRRLDVGMITDPKRREKILADRLRRRLRRAQQVEKRIRAEGLAVMPRGFRYG